MSHLRETIEDAIVETSGKPSVLKPYVLSHGTLESRDLRASRRFYEEFLGLEVVQHGQRSMALRCGMKFHIVCVQVGDQVHPMSYLTHWGLDVRSREEVEQAHAAAIANTEKYDIRKVTDPVDQHGVYSFYIQDMDHNWWEIQHYDGFQHNDMFDFGDVFDTSLPVAA